MLNQVPTRKVDSLNGQGSRVEAQLNSVPSRPRTASEVSLTLLQGDRGAVHRLALGRRSALRARHGVGAVNAAPEAGAQLQAPHVADHGRRVECLLHREG